MSKLIYCKGVHRESVSVFVWARTESFVFARTVNRHTECSRTDEIGDSRDR